MKKVLIDIKVNEIDKAKKFYCEELELFDFCQDFGMGEVTLTYKENKSIMLFLSEGIEQLDRPIFSIEIENCEFLFNRLKNKIFETDAKLLNNEVFEYPLGKNITLKDPSGNMFIVFEDNYGYIS